MLSAWAVVLLLPALLVCAFDWRKGLFAMLVVAFLQDPARKLDIDQPVYFTLLAGVVLAACYLRASYARLLWLTGIPGWKHFLRSPSYALLLIIAIEAVASVVRYDNFTIAGIGALSYLAPIPALLVGHHFAVQAGREGITRWLEAYVACALVILPTILLQYAGLDWIVLGQVGIGFEMYTENAILTANSGFFRAAETAAWHTATAVCFLLLLSSMRKLSWKQMVAAVAVIVFLLALGVLTGRRKIFVEIFIFMLTYVSLLLLFGKGGLKVAGSVFLGGVLSYGIVSWLIADQSLGNAMQTGASYQEYAGRTASVADDIWDRFLELGLEPVQWAIDGFGWFGGGLGVASQGAQHFGGGSEVFGGAGEGGLGKVTAELGVPGLLAMLWLFVSAIRYAWAILSHVSAKSAGTARLAYALLAFLIANLAVFTVATQVFGDVFVLIIAGVVCGFFLATPTLAERERAQQVSGSGATAAIRRPSRSPMPIDRPVLRR